MRSSLLIFGTARDKVLWVVLLFLTVLISAVLVSSSAHAALGLTGPEDPDSRYVLENSNTTNAKKISKLPVYVRSHGNPNFNVTIEAYNVMRGSSVDMMFSGGDSATSRSVVLRASDFKKVNNVADNSQGSLYRNSKLSISMVSPGSPSSSKYIHFRLQMKGLPSGRDGYIGYGGGVFNEASKHYYSSSSSYFRTAKLYMATPCEVNESINKDLFFYDLDHGNVDNAGQPITVKIFRKQKGKAWETSPIQVRDGSKDSGMGQGGTLKIGNFPFEVGARYRVEVATVAASNVIQYNFPFDNIAYVVDCEDAEGELSIRSSSLVSTPRSNGTWTGNPKPNTDKLNADGWSTSSNQTARPGVDRVYFKHRLKETTGDSGVEFARTRQRKIENQDGSTIATCPANYARYEQTDCIWNGAVLSKSLGSGNTVWYTVAENDRRWGSGVVSAWHAGRTICERYGVNTGNVNRAADWEYGEWQCVDILHWEFDVDTQVRVGSGGWLTDAVSGTTNRLRPGQALSFRFVLSNYGTMSSPSANSSGITGVYGREFLQYGAATGWFGSSTTQQATGTNWPSRGTVIASLGANAERIINGRNLLGRQTNIQASDAGKQLCSRYQVNWKSNIYGATTGPLDSDNLCAYVPYNYSLTPRLSSSAATLEAGTVTTLSDIGGSVFNERTANSNPATNSKATTYTLKHFTVPANQRTCVINNPTNYRSVCTGIGAEQSVYTKNATALAPEASTTSTDPFALPTSTGVICFILTINQNAVIHDDSVVNNTRTSNPSCVTLGKKPKVAVTGGEVIVGRRSTAPQGITTSTTTYPRNSNNPSNNQTSTTGSWSEYAAYASGAVSRFGTGAGFANRTATSSTISLNVGMPNVGTAACGYSSMTFTNLSATLNASTGNISPGASCANTLGSYTIQSLARPIANMLMPGATVQSNWSTNGDIRHYTGNRSINGSDVSGTVIIAVDGVATINGNITLNEDALQEAYEDGAFANIPQVIIIAQGGIVINSNVTRVDAWLITTGEGEISTCNQVGRSTSQCNAQLVVNGPVVTKKLHLYRTAGADVSNTSDWGAKPAEMFNLRADAYWWARGYAQKNAGESMRTTFIRELPPRL